MSDEKPFDRAAAGRIHIEKRWAAYRADRVARGLPPTKSQEQGRKPDRFADPEVERSFLERAESYGLFDPRDTSTQRRRKAYRLAEAEVAALAAVFSASAGSKTLPSDRDIKIAYHEAEIVRLTEARRIALRNAGTHLRECGEHEKALSVLIETGDE